MHIISEQRANDSQQTDAHLLLSVIAAYLTTGDD